MPDFNKLKDYVDKLSKLLEEPQTGLMSWNMLVSENWEGITKMWGTKETNNTENSFFSSAKNS